MIGRGEYGGMELEVKLLLNKSLEAGCMSVDCIELAQSRAL